MSTIMNWNQPLLSAYCCVCRRIPHLQRADAEPVDVPEGVVIDEAAVIERILHHLGLWVVGVRVDLVRAQPFREAGRASHYEMPGA